MALGLQGEQKDRQIRVGLRNLASTLLTYSDPHHRVSRDDSPTVAVVVAVAAVCATQTCCTACCAASRCPDLVVHSLVPCSAASRSCSPTIPANCARACALSC